MMSVQIASGEELAIHGGPKAKKSPFGTGRRHGPLEKKLLEEVIDSDVLFFYTGQKVRQFEREFAELYGMKHVVACSSGTAAVHIAAASLNLPAGSEVIVPAITDMGTLTGLLYQGLVPVFADVDAETLNVDAASVERLITERTGTIVVVHHSGLVADMGSLLPLAKRAGVPLVEDCAQAYCCEYDGRRAGTMGVIASFSLNHFKHITCGSGGMVATNDDQLRYRASLLLDKCYQREEGIRNPFFLAANYQMTELQGAVAIAQIRKVEDVVARRRTLGMRLRERLDAIPGIMNQRIPQGCTHSFFLFLFRLDLEVLRVSASDFAAALQAEGVPNSAHMITGGRPVYLYDIFQKRSAFPGTEWPFDPARIYRPGDCPVAEAAFSNWITTNVSEHYTEQDIDEMGDAIAKVARHFSGK